MSWLHMFLACIAIVLFSVSIFARTTNRRYARRKLHIYIGYYEGVLQDDEWFIQNLDHFDPTNPGTWRQRYQTNDTWFKNSPDSPVFLMIGGEGNVSSMEGAWLDYARKYNALCFQLEHRFYGKSQPKEDLSVENLRYLSSEQALADLANFIQGMNDKYKLTTTNKWIVFGGSYAGSLAAWARLKYPHLIHGAVSTSGPLLAEANFKGYNQVVRESLAASSATCAENVHQAALSVDNFLEKGNEDDIQMLSKKFNSCTSLDVRNKKDITTFVETLAGHFQETVQYNEDNFGGPILQPTVDHLCKIMDDKTIGTPLDRYAAVNKFFTNNTCIDISYSSYIQAMRNLSYDDGRSWVYQTCTEFGFYPTSSSQNDLFGSLIKLQFFVDQCKDIYGDDFDMHRLNEGIKRSNLMYGQLGIQVSRVVFVQGSLDPWHVLGINKSNNPEAPAILINGTAHCANMFPPSAKDPPQLIEARSEIAELLGEWLSN